jgi:hypothetical protein
MSSFSLTANELFQNTIKKLPPPWRTAGNEREAAMAFKDSVYPIQCIEALLEWAFE